MSGLRSAVRLPNADCSEVWRRLAVDYLRGSHRLMMVADGTRPDTLHGIADLWERAKSVTGAADFASFADAGWHVLQTSAKTGDGVEQAFHWSAERTLEKRTLGEAGRTP